MRLRRSKLAVGYIGDRDSHGDHTRPERTNES
jgi:hypothetical protein